MFNVGVHEIKNLPFGSYTIEITSLEYMPYVAKVEINQGELLHDVVVSPADEKSLNEVSIVKKTVKKEIETSGFAVSIIETKESSLRNLTTNELLDRVVGVRVRQNGGEGSPI